MVHTLGGVDFLLYLHLFALDRQLSRRDAAQRWRRVHSRDEPRSTGTMVRVGAEGVGARAAPFRSPAVLRLVSTTSLQASSADIANTDEAA